jgi:hypothetical protein
MKKVFTEKHVYNIPESFIQSSYAGASAAHQVIEHENMGLGQGDFRAFYNRDTVQSECTAAVESLPDRLSLREVVSSSPAANKYGGF